MLSIACCVLLGFADPDVRVLDARKLHLGNDSNKRFIDISEAPQGERLEISFEATRNSDEQVLLIHQRDVSDEWLVELNGKRVGTLAREASAYELRVRLPAGALTTGKNDLVVRSKKVSDDIIVGDVRIDPRPLREVLRLEPVAVTIRETNGGPVPARVDFVKQGGGKPQLFESAEGLAARAGVIYTASGVVATSLEPGVYDVYATRGMEWGMAKGQLTLDGAGDSSLALEIAREVDTTGYVAADTHIHTVTYSGHGDATVDERLVTLAAQGVELAIATDHNHFTDYRPLQRDLGIADRFTPVIGNEVTTDAGHFTAFPFDTKGPVPDWKQKDFVKLVDDIRAKGAKVVFLNHPRWPQIDTGVFANVKLDRVTGETNGTQQFTVNGIEVVNTNTPLDDSRYVLTDWFALLNAGCRLWGVASSDSHTVGEPVGMGRTYVRSATDDPSRIDVDACCNAYRKGLFSIAFGIFADCKVNDARSGETVNAENRPLTVNASVRHPSWVHLKSVTVFENGLPVATQPGPAYAGPQGHSLSFTIDAPRHDGWIVVVAEGDDVAGAWWPGSEKYTLGITNPIFVDADGDGVAASPREVAEAAWKKTGEWKKAIEGLDDAAAIQVLALLLREPNEVRRRELGEFGTAGADGRARLAEFLVSRTR